MLAKNSSSVLAFSAPDHFVTRDIRDKSLCTVCVRLDPCSFSLSSSVFISASFNLASAVLIPYLSNAQKFRIFYFNCYYFNSYLLINAISYVILVPTLVNAR